MFAALLRIARVVAGVGLIIVGIAAFFTPLTPGSWLVFVGFEMLGWRVAYGRYLHNARRAFTRWWGARHGRS